MATIDPILVQNFNDGGLSDSKFSGIANSLYKFIGFDPHSTPGILKAAQRMDKNSTALIDEFCMARLSSSNGRTYWGSYESGKIWERDQNGIWTLVTTISSGSGQSKILNLAEYQGVIYIFTQLKIHKIVATDAEGATEWGSNLVQNWATFGNGDLEYHPTIEQNLVLYIGDGNYIAQIDDGVFSQNALDVKDPLRVKSLGKIGTRILAGTYIADNITKTQIVDWDTFSDSFRVSDTIDEVGIHAFLEADNYTYCYCGYSGNLYIYNGEALELYKKIPGDYSPTARAVVNPTSVANKEGEILFGVSNVEGNPCDQALYRIGRNSRPYKYILDTPYPISQRYGTDFVLTNVEIGGVLVVGSDIYMAWRRRSTITVTIATPGVVTFTNHGLSTGDPIKFYTDGALPTGITAGTTYYVRVINDNTFNLYDTSAHATTGGATGRVNTSGSQSGVHTSYVVGIDKLNYNAKLSGAYFESRVARGDRFRNSTFGDFEVAYCALPDNTSIGIAYKANYEDTYHDMDTKVDDIKNIVMAEDSVEGVALQCKVSIVADGNNAPEIEALYVPIK